MSGLIRGVVLEGCSAAGKTSVLRALKAAQAELGRERSVVVLAEHYSQALQRNSDGHRRLSCDEHRTLLSARLDALESLGEWAARAPCAPRESAGVLFVLERFHLNHRSSYPEDGAWSEAVEARLARLGAVCALLTVSPQRAAERVSTRVTAAELESATAAFLVEQEVLARAAEASRLGTVRVCTDEQGWNRHAREILERLERE